MRALGPHVTSVYGNCSELHFTARNYFYLCRNKRNFCLVLFRDSRVRSDLCNQESRPGNMSEPVTSGSSEVRDGPLRAQSHRVRSYAPMAQQNILRQALSDNYSSFRTNQAMRPLATSPHARESWPGDSGVSSSTSSGRARPATTNALGMLALMTSATGSFSSPQMTNRFNPFRSEADACLPADKPAENNSISAPVPSSTASTSHAPVHQVAPRHPNTTHSSSSPAAQQVAAHATAAHAHLTCAACCGGTAAACSAPTRQSGSSSVVRTGNATGRAVRTSSPLVTGKATENDLFSSATHPINHLLQSTVAARESPVVTSVHVPHDPGANFVDRTSNGIYLHHEGKRLSKSEFQALKDTQRDSQSYYKSAFAFPAASANEQKKDTLQRSSVKAAPLWCCHGVLGCQLGDCLKQFEALDVKTARDAALCRCVVNKPDGGATHVATLGAILEADIRGSYNRTTDQWSRIKVHLDEFTSVEVCVSSYALLLGASSAVLVRAVRAIKNGTECCSSALPRAPQTSKECMETRSLDFSLLRSYVSSLLNSHESNPAPGATQPKNMTFITRTPWRHKWKACEDHFRVQGSPSSSVPGSLSMLKRVWKLENRLKERRACSHSKCDVCSLIDSHLEKCKGMNTLAHQAERENLKRAYAEHEADHLSARQVHSPNVDHMSPTLQFQFRSLLRVNIFF